MNSAKGGKVIRVHSLVILWIFAVIVPLWIVENTE